MKEYIVIKAFSILDKVLILPEDKIYAEQNISQYRIFNAKTRKFIGAVSAEKFETLVKEASDFKIYDNEPAKKKLIGYLDAMKIKTRSKNSKEDYQFLKEVITELF